jgi:hypothetical protein
MVLPPAGYPPPRRWQDSQLVWQSQTVEGLEVYRSTTLDGEVLFEAPALNFFAVLREVPSGVKDVYSEIKLHEPDPSLFEPPPGTAVEYVNEPGGIIWRPRRQ